MLTARYGQATDLSTIARAGNAWALGAAGAPALFGANSLRHDYDPVTLAYRGVLVDRARTNQSPNPWLVGAAAGVPGTLPTSWGWSFTQPVSAALGGTAARPWIELTFAPAASGSTNIRFSTSSISVVSGATYTTGFHLGFTAPLPAQITSVLHFTPAAANAAISLGSIPTDGTVRRFTRSDVATSTTAGQHGCRITWSGACTFTIRVALPTFIEGTLADALLFPAVGATGVSTAAADEFSTQGIPPWINSAAGTVVVDFMPGATAAETARGIIALDDGTTNNYVGIYLAAASLAASMLAVSNGVTAVPNLPAGTATVLARNTLRLSWGPAGYYASLNGAAPLIDQIGAMPLTLSRVRLGNLAGADAYPLQGWVGPRVAYLPFQYTDVAAADGLTIRDC